MSPVSSSEPHVITAKDAIARHIRWRVTLQFAVSRQEQLDPEDVHAIDHLNECSIGKWLKSSHTVKIRQTPEYRALIARHEEFHREMQKIARLIESKKFAAAERALDPDSSFKKAAQAIASAINAVDSIQTIAIAS